MTTSVLIVEDTPEFMRRFSDAVLRHLVVNMDEAVTEPSPMAKAAQEEKEGGPRRSRDDSPFASDDDDMGVNA